MSDGIRTAFHGAQEARGATFVEEGGWFWSVSFGDADAEYSAVRDGVGMWDVSPLNKWDFRGPDAVEAAQRVHSNDILGLEVGQVRYGAFLDEDGLLVDWLAPAGDADVGAALVAWALARARAEDCERLTALFPESAPEWLAFQRLGLRVHATRYFLVAWSFSAVHDLEWMRRHWYYTLGDTDLA